MANEAVTITGGRATKADQKRLRLPPKFVDGLVITWVSATQVSIGVGSCRDVDDTWDIVVGSTLTAAITTSGANGLDTGSEAAATFYFLWVIMKSSDSTVAALLSTSSTSPTMPSGYDLKRRVGVTRNNGSSDFTPFQCHLDDGGRTRRYYIDDTQANLQALSNGTATTFTDISLSTWVPPTSTMAIMGFGIDGTVAASFRPNGMTGLTSGNIACGANFRGMWGVEIMCPGQIVEYANSAGGGSTDAYVTGFIDVV